MHRALPLRHAQIGPFAFSPPTKVSATTRGDAFPQRVRRQPVRDPSVTSGFASRTIRQPTSLSCSTVPRPLATPKRLPAVPPITRDAKPLVFDIESHAKFWSTFAASKARASTLQSLHVAYEFDSAAGLPSAETQRALIENMLVKLPALPSALDVLTVSVGEALRWQWRRSTTEHNALPASPHMQPVSADDAAERLQLETAW